ncbi:hypothetical protein BG011_005916 [Mortierella polycephala]|uniref:Uncharacterized protein n=1 Tax=Mortierella polycephala TaxID=41804 RepID=A0A9P6PVZ2_9FUNG|nr:hypothetical protein BG011_005916 [Mortierella polycephala]
MNADRNDNSSLASSHIARYSRNHTSSSSRFATISRFGEGGIHQRVTNALTAGSGVTTATITVAPTTTTTTTSFIAKPAPRTQKSTGIKPPSIVTKPNSGIQKGTTVLPPTTPSPIPGTSSMVIGFVSVASATSSSGIPLSIASPQNITSPSTTLARPKKRLQAGIDSACFMTRSSSSESPLSLSAPSSTSSAPTGSPTPAIPTPSTTAISSTSPSTSPSIPSSKHLTGRRKPTLKRGSNTDIAAISTIASSPTSSPSPSSIVKTSPRESRPTSILPPPPSTAPPAPPTSAVTSFTVATPTTPSPLKTIIPAPLEKEELTVGKTKAFVSNNNNNNADNKVITSITSAIVQCHCPPQLQFPENVKREMKREEEEHRQRECGLYAKIIELQIENENLKSEKETLIKFASRRDKMLLELQMQLQAMEFVCRENEIKVDIDMCPDEAIQNWSFKESDEVYQRILLTTQDLLRSGSKCLEENMPPSRSSGQHHRSTRPSSRASGMVSPDHSIPSGPHRGNVVAGLSEGAQPVVIQDQNADSLVFKQTSRPGTLKFNTQSLVRSENEFNSHKSGATVDQPILSQVGMNIEGNGRRALDCGDDRSGLFQEDDDDYYSDEVDVDDDDDDEGQESEFEELGEDMIKYVELQSSVGPRRDTRSSSLSKMMSSNASAAATPDLSTAVLMKNLWSGGARRTAGTMPMQHPVHQHPVHQHPVHQHPVHQHQQQVPSYRRSSNRSSSESSTSSRSSLDDYFVRGPHHMDQVPVAHIHQGAHAGIGLGLTGLARSPEHPSMERFLTAPPTCALPPSPLASPRSHPSVSRSPLSTGSSATFGSHLHDNDVVCLPPVTPLPPLPSRPRYSYRDHTKSMLMQSKRPSHGRTCSHGFVIEEVGHFLKRKTYGKTLTRDVMHRGHRRRDSV